MENKLQIKFPPLEPALYLVSTPIGTAADFSFRGVNVLTNADILLAEDTRVLKKLLRLFEINPNNKLIRNYSDNSTALVRSRCIADLEDKKSIAYCSDAGTPLISDPGYKLVKEVVEKGFKVRSIPGASAVLTALCQSGLPSDRFFFGGFPPSRKSQRLVFFKEYSLIPATLIFFESARRLIVTLEDLQEIFGDNHTIVICRELTKRYEENNRGSIKNLIIQAQKSENIRGEFTILVDRKEVMKPDQNLLVTQLTSELSKSSLRDASAFIAEKYSLSKKDMYKLGLKILKK